MGRDKGTVEKTRVKTPRKKEKKIKKS